MLDSPIWALYIAAFFVLYFGLRAATTGNEALNLLIAIGSLAYYAAWNVHAALLVTLLAVFLYWFNPLKDRLYAVVLYIGVALMLLAIVKYGGNWIYVQMWFGVDNHSGRFYVIGISFYVFTIIGYIVDVAFHGQRPLARFRDLLVLIAFWPHLAAGPILRLRNIRQGIEERHPLTDGVIRVAVMLIAGGLAKKYFLADGLGVYVDANIKSGLVPMTGLEAALTLIGFAGQIYFDFSGYSDIAIGSAFLMGFRLPANFNYPYLATSVSEFWRRWHISLSYWFRDYVFIPLGGNRRGNLYLNLMIAFLLSGIWHGVGMSFIIWGAIHGAFVCAEKFFASFFDRLNVIFRRIYLWTVVLAAWAFFRVPAGDARIWLRRICDFSSYHWNPDSRYFTVPILFFAAFLVIDHLVRYYRVDDDGMIEKKAGVWPAVYAVTLFFLFLVFHGNTLPFIYFKF